MLKKIKIPSHKDARGNLSVIELRDFVKWTPKRVYYVTNVLDDRGAHAMMGEKKIYVCMNGKVKARFHDGKKWYKFELKGPDEGILMEGFYWRDFSEFAPETVLTAISNINYDEKKYIRNFDDFLKKAK